MSRTHYRNGDEVSLANCDGCSPLMIQGVLCHETGCPEAWRDREVECFECGCKFFPSEAPPCNKSSILCEDCANPEPIEDQEGEEAVCRQCGHNFHQTEGEHQRLCPDCYRDLYDDDCQGD